MTKEERKIYNKEYNLKNKEKIKLYNELNKHKKYLYSKEYQRNNKEKQKEYEKKHLSLNKESKIIYRKEYHKIHKEKYIEYRKENKEHKKNYDKLYIELNKERKKNYNLLNKEYKKEYARLYHNKKRIEDSFYKLKKIISSLIYQSLKIRNHTKNSRTYEILGCTYEELKIHLEKQFKSWMTWDNQGNPKDGIFELNKSWDIDHIIPLSSAKTEEDIYKLNHYTNLQPLCSYDNRFVKRDNIYYYNEKLGIKEERI